MFPRHEMLDLVVVDGRARGIVARDLVTGEIESHVADAVVLATGGYGNVFYLSTYAKGCNATAIWRAYKKGAAFANPCYTQIHPTCIPVTRRLPVEAHPDERVAAQRRPDLGAEEEGRHARRRTRSPRTSATTTSSASTRASATSPRATSPRARPSRSATRAAASAPSGLGVYLDFADAIKRLGEDDDRARSTATSSRCTSGSPTRTPTRSRCGSTPPSHYTMGGLWVDYNLMSTIPGLFVLGEANFSDHGANRLGRERADAGPGRRLLRHPLHDRQLPRRRRSSSKVDADHPEVAGGRGARSTERTQAAARDQGQAHGRRRSTASSARSCGSTAAWRATRQGLETALAEDPRAARGVLEERQRARATARS